MVGYVAGSRTLHDVRTSALPHVFNEPHTHIHTVLAVLQLFMVLQFKDVSTYVCMLACHWAVQCNIHCAQMTSYECPRTWVTCLLFFAAVDGSKECIWFTVNILTTIKGQQSKVTNQRPTAKANNQRSTIKGQQSKANNWRPTTKANNQRSTIKGQ